MGAPFISVVIPTYNSAHSLAKALDSVAQQTYAQWEIILVDGLSKDATVAIASAFAGQDKRLRWISEKDNGIYDAINKGIRLSQGEWVYVLGSDDALYAPGTLEQVSKTLVSSSADAVYGNVKVVGNANWAQDGDLYDGEFTIDKLIHKNICQQAVFYRREVFGRFGYFDTEYPVCADWDFALRCAAKGTLQFTDQVICNFTAGGASTVVKKEPFIENKTAIIYSYFGRRIGENAFASLAKSFELLAQEFRRRRRWLDYWIVRKACRRHANR